MTTIAEQLKAARKLIESENAWCKGAAALDAEGRVRFAHDSAAVSWCAVGALLRVHASTDAHRAIHEACGYSVGLFNDSPATTHADVLAAFDRAIASAKK